MALTSSRTASNVFVPDFPPSWSKEIGLIVHVVEARGLLNKDMFGGKSNPFVVLKLWGQERVSHVIKNCLSPKWNQTFQFSLYNIENVADDELTVTLWDKDNLFKNGFLGMVKINIGSLIDNQVHDLWYPLEKRSSKSRVRGNIRLWTQLTTAAAKETPNNLFHSSFTMSSVSATLDGASIIPYSRQEESLDPNLLKTNTSTLSYFKPTPITTTTTPTLDESDFLHIEPTRQDKGKGKSKDEWCLRSPSSPPCFPPPSPPSPHPSSLPTPPHVYYDAFGDPVEDADMIAILKMEEEEKRAKELEEERLFREYLSTLQRCSVCGADDGGDPLSLPCDHTFCRDCLASHIRNILKTKKRAAEAGIPDITCPTCDSVVPEWAVKRALPTSEHEALLNQSLQSFIDSGHDIFRCPNPTCGAPIERIPHLDKPPSNKVSPTHGVGGPNNTTVSVVVDQHCSEYRFRCRFCSTEFCSGCQTIPYHAGYTCEGYDRYLKAKHCRFCAITLDAANSAGPSTTGITDVCKGEECVEKSKLSCKKWNPCGHSCCGVLDEQQCLPCLQCQDGTGEQTAEDFCNICWVESLASAPSIRLQCGHVFHYTCIKSKIKKRWPAARITFGFSECPLCKQSIEHPALEEELKPIRELKAMVQQKASQRLEFEGLSKAKEVTDPSSKFFNNRDRYAMDRYAYFMCAKCVQPYFAGQRRCDAGEEEKPFDPADLVCGACSGSTLAAECAVHGKDFLEWKCQFCCTISSWYCWGKTHFCNDCHTRQQKGDYLTKKPKSAIPMCPGLDKCPLGVAHPHCEEYLLGCALCRNVRTF